VGFDKYKVGRQMNSLGSEGAKTTKSPVIEKAPRGTKRLTKRMPHPPIIQLTPINATFPVGGTATLSCRIIVSDTHPHIQWLRHHDRNDSDSSHYIDEDTKEQYVQVIKTGTVDDSDPERLVLYNLTLQDQGKYTCFARNAIGGTARDTWIFISNGTKDDATIIPVDPLPGTDRDRAPRTPAKRQGCPLCPSRRTILSPQFLQALVCNASQVYMAVAGRKGAVPIKLRNHLLSGERVRKGWKVTNVSLPAECQCNLLEKPAKKVVIVTKYPPSLPNRQTKKFNLNLDDTSAVFLANKRLVRAVKRAARNCS